MWISYSITMVEGGYVLYAVEDLYIFKENKYMNDFVYKMYNLLCGLHGFIDNVNKLILAVSL